MSTLFDFVKIVNLSTLSPILCCSFCVGPKGQPVYKPVKPVYKPPLPTYPTVKPYPVYPPTKPSYVPPPKPQAPWKPLPYPTKPYYARSNDIPENLKGDTSVSPIIDFDNFEIDNN